MSPSTEPRRLESSGPQDTEAIGASLARDLRPGDVVLVAGEVGAGKTTLVRGAVRELGHRGRVTSPTFTMVNRYEGGRLPVSHLDLYRLAETGTAGEDPGLLADELADDRVAFVEWPPTDWGDFVPPGGTHSTQLRITLRHAGGDRRVVEIAS